MKKWVGVLFAMVLMQSGCIPRTQAIAVTQITAAYDKMESPTPKADTEMETGGEKYLRDYGPAPELTNIIWLNSEQPLRLKNLHGKVVLLDMWTFGCINCRNTIPFLKEWHEKYGQDGLVIIANHYPEFSYEADLENLKEAVKDLEIHYAVAQDNEGITWQAYHNRYWPTLYLIDKRGTLRYSHIGEGRYEETEKAIQALLAESVKEE